MQVCILRWTFRLETSIYPFLRSVVTDNGKGRQDGHVRDACTRAYGKKPSARARRDADNALSPDNPLYRPSRDPPRRREIPGAMVVRSRSSLRVSARRDDADPAASTRASRRRLDGDAPSLAHAKGALDQKDSRPHRPLPRRPARPQRPSSRRPPLSSRPASAAHGRPPRRARPPSAAPAKQPLRCRESPDPLNTISSPTASPPRPRPRLSAPAALAGSGAASPPSAAATRATRRSGHALPVAVDNDADKTPAGPSTSGDDAARPNGAPRSSTRNPPAASNGNVVPTERRSLRSHDGGSRSRSELAQYFPNYEQMISLEPPKPGEHGALW